MTEIPDLTEEKHAAVVAALRELIADDKFPLSPRLKPLKSALAKMALQPPRQAPAAAATARRWPALRQRRLSEAGSAQPARHRLVRAGRAAAAVAMAFFGVELRQR